MFFITGFSYVIAFFWICPIFVQFIRGDGGKSAMPSQGNRSRGSATYAGWGENPLTPNQNHWQKRRNMSNICPKLDIITCQFDCTRILCDGSDGLDLSFLVTYCQLLSLDSKNVACEAFAGKHLGTKRFVAKIKAERIGTERRTWKHSAWWQRDVWKICSRFWGQAMEQYQHL